ncbi:MAG: nucleotidyltransferase [Gammaproteobacteria bacterium]|nr:nucleotidyltransferase [Gammaproteobacteria bacterium]
MTGLERICTALADAGVRYAVVGGHAVALHGAVRGTVDIDVALAWNRKTLVAAENALTNLGLVSRLPVSAGEIYDFRQEFIENRNLLAWNFYDPNDLSLQVDIVINYDLKGKRTKRIQMGSGSITVLSLKDLIDMKRQSGRPQDVEDVAALEKLR